MRNCAEAEICAKSVRAFCEDFSPTQPIAGSVSWSDQLLALILFSEPATFTGVTRVVTLRTCFKCGYSHRPGDSFLSGGASLPPTRPRLFLCGGPVRPRKVARSCLFHLVSVFPGAAFLFMAPHFPGQDVKTLCGCSKRIRAPAIVNPCVTPCPSCQPDCDSRRQPAPTAKKRPPLPHTCPPNRDTLHLLTTGLPAVAVGVRFARSPSHTGNVCRS